MKNKIDILLNNFSELKLIKLSKSPETLEKIDESMLDNLIDLTNIEVDAKKLRANQAMIKTAGFPSLKTIEEFDFSFQEDLDKDQILELATLKFVDNKENVVFLGNSGVGKTHLATAIGIKSAQNRFSTYFIKCHDLIIALKRAFLENRLEEVLKKYNRYRVLIIDELGYLPINSEDSKLLFQLIDKRYENKSTIFTTNIPFNKWDTIFNDPLIASAIIDRVLHHCNVVQITGNSFRIKNYVE